MPRIKYDLKKFIEAREHSTTKQEIVKKTGYPEKTVEYFLRVCNQNDLKFSHRLKRVRGGIDWNDARAYLESIKK